MNPNDNKVVSLENSVNEAEEQPVFEQVPAEGQEAPATEPDVPEAENPEAPVTEPGIPETEAPEEPVAEPGVPEAEDQSAPDFTEMTQYGVDVTQKKPPKTKDHPPLSKLMNPKNLQTEVSKYGYNFSAKKFYLSVLVAFAVAIGVGFLFKLSIPFILVIFIVCTLCVPSILLTSYKNMYESKRFHDVSNYMEQLLYSFRRKKKILTSLEDVLIAFEGDRGPMGGLIEKAIRYIQTSETQGDIYREALDIIEQEYDNARLRNVHNFLIAVENNGGDVEAPVDLLLNERAMWDERTHTFQKEKNSVKKSIVVSIVFSLGLCFLLLFILSMSQLKELSLPTNIVVQFSSTFVILASVLLYAKITNKLSQSWLKKTRKHTDYQILRDYFDVINRDKKAEWKSRLVWTAATSVIAILGAILGNTVVLVIGIAIMAFCFFAPTISMNLAVKNVTKEIEIAFPQWLMELALLLQGNNVQVAISKTLDTAPVVLRPELKKLVEGFERDTHSIVPYNEFLKTFDLPEIKSAMRMLYSITATGTGNIDEQITDLIKKQNVLMDRAEKISNEESLAGFSTLTMVPMLFCIVKSLVDMTILVFSLFGMVATSM